MAEPTPAHNPDKKEPKKVNITLPRGICQITRASGLIVYKVTVGTGQRRQQLVFGTLDEGEAYKTFADAFYAEHETAPTREQFVTTRETSAESSSSLDHGLAQVGMGAMVREIGEELADELEDEGALGFLINVILRFLTERKLLDLNASDFSRKHAKNFREWIHAENYERGVQSQLLSIFRRLMIEAEGHDYTRRNPFLDMTPLKKALPELDRRGRSREVEDAPAWTVEQLVAIASLLRQAYVFPFWVLTMLGLRVSEAMGLRLRDWDPEFQTIRVHKQRRFSPRRGRSKVKTSASRRIIPVGNLLAALIETYIRMHHGPVPHEPAAREAWLDRYLLIGVKGGPMDQSSFRSAVSDATTALGFTRDAVGRLAVLHHLRKSVGALLQSSMYKGQLTGRAISDYLGHKTAASPVLDRAAVITRTHYSPQVIEELNEIAAFLDTWMHEEILPLVSSGDLLEPAPVSDPVTIGEAARRLSGVLAETVTEADVTELIGAGSLTVAVNNHVGPLNDRHLVLSAAELDGVIAQSIRASSDSYCASEVAEMLYTDHRGVYRLADAGDVVEVTLDPRMRRARHGNRGGALPGGGRRFTKTSVDALVEADADRIRHLREWLTVGQASEILGVSTDTIRRMGDRNKLIVWRDPKSYRNERRVCPDSVRAARAETDVAVPSVAAELGITESHVCALLKLGELAAGSGPKTVLRRSVDTYRVRHAA